MHHASAFGLAVHKDNICRNQTKALIAQPGPRLSLQLSSSAAVSLSSRIKDFQLSSQNYGSKIPGGFVRAVLMAEWLSNILSRGCNLQEFYFVYLN